LFVTTPIPKQYFMEKVELLPEHCHHNSIV